MNISVILSTYNQPKWLELCLLAWNQQTYRNFEVIIADDGSSEETAHLIKKIRTEVGYPIKHIWHEDNGFQKCAILNKATLSARYDYLFYSDGDCLPRPDLLSIHARHAQKQFFLSGSYFKLDQEVSRSITKEEVISSEIFEISKLLEKGQPKSQKMIKLKPVNWLTPILEKLTPTKATWNGHCSSGWKQDILAVNGYNEIMKYGGEDRELGERLVNSGLKPKQLRHHTCLLHLDHPRGYVDQELVRKNQEIRNSVIQNKITWAPNGIEKDAFR